MHDYWALYGRLLTTTYSLVFLSSDTNHHSTALQLMSPTFSAMIHLCDYPPKRSTVNTCAWQLKSFMRVVLASTEDDKHVFIEKCVPQVDKFLHLNYRPNWDVVLPVFSQAILPLTKDDSHLKALVALRSNVDDKPSQKSIDNAILILLQHWGFEVFLKAIPLNDGNSKFPIAQNRVFLLPLLQQHAKSAQTDHASSPPPRLSFFQLTILDLARKCDAATAWKNLTAMQSSMEKKKCIDLWSLFPAFCFRPSDLSMTLPGLVPTLARAVQDSRYPQLVTIICNGLQILATEVSNQSTQHQNVVADPQDLQTLSQASTKLLPTLFKLVETLSGATPSPPPKTPEKDSDDESTDSAQKPQKTEQTQRIDDVVSAIAALATIAPKPFLRNLFQKVMQRLLTACSSDKDNAKICSLLSLSQALIASKCLDEESVSLLYRVLRPCIQSDEYNVKIQKRAYKVMAQICDKYREWVLREEKMLKEVLELMVGSTESCWVAARFWRVKCLHFVVQDLDPMDDRHMAIIPEMLGEVLLCLKDSNAKTRDATYALLLSIARLQDDKTSLIQTVLAGIGGQTAQMQSASITALSRLVFEFAREDDKVQQTLPSLLQTILLVLNSTPPREVTKSGIGFVRVCVAAMPKDDLEIMLKELLRVVMKYAKDRFRAKIKIILKKLVKIYGYEVITPLMPSNDARLLTHMRKLSERAKRKHEQAVANYQNNADHFEQLIESDEDDSDDGCTLMTRQTALTKQTYKSSLTMQSATSQRTQLTAKTNKSGKTAKSAKTNASQSSRDAIHLRTEKDGQIFDMLNDTDMAKNIQYPDNYDDDSDYDMDDDDDIIEFDDSGRIVVHDAPVIEEASEHEDDDNTNRNKKPRVSKFEAAKATKTQKSKSKSLGSEYKAKNAGGDTRRKNQKYQPYAYVPLDARNYSKNKRKDAVAQMSSVVKGKKGKRKRS